MLKNPILSKKAPEQPIINTKIIMTLIKFLLKEDFFVSEPTGSASTSIPLFSDRLSSALHYKAVHLRL